jgi:hypothetical protein
MWGQPPSAVRRAQLGVLCIAMSAPVLKPRPQAVPTILLGGLIAGILDGLDAVVFYRTAFSVPPARLFQGIARGLLGPPALTGGWKTVVLGIALHFTVAIGSAAFFYAASLLIPALLRHPWICGPAFGVVLYLFMQHVVIPLSAIPKRTHPAPLIDVIDQLFSHMFFVGLPIALMAHRSARVAPGRT